MKNSEIIERYLPIIKKINLHIESFNLFINEGFKIELIDENKLDDDLYFHCMNNKKWEQISFPRNNDESGVYFYFGYSLTNPKDLCVYVGKASLSSKTGIRLWQHFKNAFDENGIIFKFDNLGNRFNIETVIVIPLEKKGTTILSPALEEHLINELVKDNSIKILNIRGN